MGLGGDVLGDRFNDGKLRWGLVDFKALEPMVRVLESGSKKYSDNNWKKGFNYVDVCESLMRHLFDFLSGEDNDHDSGLPLVGHILSNAMFLSYMFQNRKDLDNRYKNEKQ